MNNECSVSVNASARMFSKLGRSHLLLFLKYNNQSWQKMLGCKFDVITNVALQNTRALVIRKPKGMTAALSCFIHT